MKIQKSNVRQFVVGILVAVSIGCYAFLMSVSFQDDLHFSQAALHEKIEFSDEEPSVVLPDATFVKHLIALGKTFLPF